MKGNHMKRKRIVTDKNGTIRLQKEIIITDPCYEPENWCNVIKRNVQPGIYNIFTRHVSNRDKYINGISRVMLIHENYMEYFVNPNMDLIKDDDPSAIKYSELTFKKADNPIGIDSGLAGFFNLEYFENIKNKSTEEKDKWWDRICEIAGKDTMSIDDNGFFTTNWFGDGGYTLYLFTDSNDTEDETVVGFVLNYELEKL